jgi:hypothetical protein
LLLVRRIDGDSDPSARQRVLMAGEVVTPTTVMEIISMIASSRWIGSLHVTGEGSHRALGFHRGVLRHAHSDHPEDRLDKVLVRVGVFKPNQIETVMQDLRGERRLGELLVEKGLLEHRQLFGCLREQMAQIFLSTVLVERGGYAFCIPGRDEAPPPAVAHIPLQQLLLDAAERVDRLASFRRLVPSLEMRPEVEAGVQVAHLDPRARLVVGYCDGDRTLREIASETWLGRFETVATVYDLVRTGRVRLRPPRRTSVDMARQLVEPFNATLQDVYSTLESHGGVGRLREDLDRWSKETPEAEDLVGVLDPEGLCRPEALAEKLIGGGTYHQLEALRHALHELTSFALFSASLRLPRETERSLSRRAQHRLELNLPKS